MFTLVFCYAPDSVHLVEQAGEKYVVYAFGAVRFGAFALVFIAFILSQ